MFCPKCEYEYQEGISRCPDCDVDLVSQLPVKKEEALPVYKDWIQLARINSQPLADMVLETLRSKEIPAVIISGTGYFGQTGQFGIGSFQPVGGGYSLYVPSEFAADADAEAAIVMGDEWEKSKLFDLET